MKENQKTLKIILIIPIIFLTGCAGMNSKFDCNIGPGGTCRSMDQVNKEASSGVFNTNSIPVSAARQNSTNLGYPLLAYKGQPIRTGETIQRIWIAPFEDQDDNYHEPSYVYTVVKKSEWIGNPVKETAED
jgi:conjugal transfer pilus assembly protein TraV